MSIKNEVDFMNEKSRGNEHIYKAVDSAIRIGFLGLLVIWCFSILKPLIVTVVWGIIIAVAIFPMHRKLTGILGGKGGLSAGLITLIGIGVLVVPTILFVNSTVDSIQGVAKTLESGSLNIQPPKEEIASLPVIGSKLFTTWQLASTNLEELMVRVSPQLKELAPRVLAVIAGLGVTILQFVISIIVAGIFLVNAEAASRGADKIFGILVGDYVDDFPQIAAGTIRSVVQGVLGIAVIQTILSGLGMLVMGIPATGLWCLLILILVIMQLPPILILLPVAGYAFTIADTTPAVIFLIWCIFVSLLDNILKPLLLGRGMDIPMLVILLGAIGGMVSYGLIGLFVGSVILCLGYKVIGAIMDKNQERSVSKKEE